MAGPIESIRQFNQFDNPVELFTSLALSVLRNGLHGSHRGFIRLHRVFIDAGWTADISRLWHRIGSHCVYKEPHSNSEHIEENWILFQQAGNDSLSLVPMGFARVDPSRSYPISAYLCYYNTVSPDTSMEVPPCSVSGWTGLPGIPQAFTVDLRGRTEYRDPLLLTLCITKKFARDSVCRSWPLMAYRLETTWMAHSLGDPCIFLVALYSICPPGRVPRGSG
ncbi:hypothetical protein V1505DRAFT_20478 [Lipomyces doorenjongii]